MPKSVKQIINSTKTVISSSKSFQKKSEVISEKKEFIPLTQFNHSENEPDVIDLEANRSQFQAKQEKVKFSIPKIFGKKKEVKSEIDELVDIPLNKNEFQESDKSLITTAKPENKDVSTYVKEVKLEKKDPWFKQFMKPEYGIAFLISLVCAFLFIFAGGSNAITKLLGDKFRLETVLKVILGILLVLDFVFLFLIGKNWHQRLHVFVALLTLQFSAFLYSMKVTNTELFKVSELAVTTQIALGIMPIIIFMQMVDLIQKKNRMWVNIGQVFIILNQLFSTVKVFNENSLPKKQFSFPFINWLLDLPPSVWVLFATIGLAILSTYNLKQGYTRFIFVMGMMFPILNMLLLTRVTTTWYQTILALIVWDMIYTPMFEAEKEKTDDRVISRLMVSSVYHIVLFAIFLTFNTVLNFVISRN
ncbi:MAG: hypothetical protein ACRCXZ_02285 [Patescibacteria group bacterium]